MMGQQQSAAISSSTDTTSGIDVTTLTPDMFVNVSVAEESLVQSIQDSINFAIAESQSEEGKTRRYLNEVFCAPFHEFSGVHKDIDSDVYAMFTDKAVPWRQRAENLKNFYLELFEAHPEGFVGVFTDNNDIEEWYQESLLLCTKYGVP